MTGDTHGLPQDVENLVRVFTRLDRMAQPSSGIHRRDAPRLIAQEFDLPPVAAQGVLVLWESTSLAGGTARSRVILAMEQHGAFR